MNKETARKGIKETCGDGWLTLVDIVYDNIPADIEITEVFQKWGGLEIRYDGENKLFEELVDNVNYMSKKICEICGKSGGYAIVDGWETTLCDLHYNNSDAKDKYRNPRTIL